VSVKDITTGNMNAITITNDKARLSTLEIKKMIEEAKKYHMEDMQFLSKAKVMSELDSCVYNLKKASKKWHVKLMLSRRESEKINNAISVAMSLLDKNNREIAIILMLKRLS
jgi:heat shock 70kDa protein 1/2/6/8